MDLSCVLSISPEDSNLVVDILRGRERIAVVRNANSGSKLELCMEDASVARQIDLKAWLNVLNHAQSMLKRKTG